MLANHHTPQTYLIKYKSKINNVYVDVSWPNKSPSETHFRVLTHSLGTSALNDWSETRADLYSIYYAPQEVTL